MTYQEKYLELKRNYLRDLNDKSTSLVRAWSEVKSGANFNFKNSKLHRELHRLAGSAGSYDLDDLSDIAKQIQRNLLNTNQNDEWRKQTDQKLKDLLSLMNKYAIDK